MNRFNPLGFGLEMERRPFAAAMALAAALTIAACSDEKAPDSGDSAESSGTAMEDHSEHMGEMAENKEPDLGLDLQGGQHFMFELDDNASSACRQWLDKGLQEPALLIVNAWSRFNPIPGRPAAAYFEIMNAVEDDRLVGVSAEIAERAELHTHVHKDGVMSMEKLDALDVPKGGEVQFRSGGHHVMLFGVGETPETGTSFPIVLEFEKAGDVTVNVHVGERADLLAEKGTDAQTYILSGCSE